MTDKLKESDSGVKYESDTSVFSENSDNVCEYDSEKENNGQSKFVNSSRPRNESPRSRKARKKEVKQYQAEKRKCKRKKHEKKRKDKKNKN